MLSQAQIRELRKAPGAPNRLRRAMQMAGVTQVQVAEATGSTQSHIAEISNGNYSRLPLETARALASTFGCSIEDLFPAPQEAGVR